MEHTRGPWIWDANRKTGQVRLVTEGRGRVFVMDFYRHGMQGAQPAFQEHRNGCDGTCHGCGLMVKLFEMKTPADHNGYFDVDHPDARLIAASPELLDALKDLVARYDDGTPTAGGWQMWNAKAAITKAEGKKDQPAST